MNQVSRNSVEMRIPQETAVKLVSFYGSNISNVVSYIQSYQESDIPVEIASSVQYAIEHGYPN